MVKLDCLSHGLPYYFLKSPSKLVQKYTSLINAIYQVKAWNDQCQIFQVKNSTFYCKDVQKKDCHSLFLFFFKINCSLKPNLNSKLVISHFWTSSYGGSYKITIFLCVFLYVCLSVCLSLCLSVCQFDIFFRNGSLVFSDILKNILENIKTYFFPGKLIFAQIWASSSQMTPKQGFFEKSCHYFFLEII